MLRRKLGCMKKEVVIILVFFIPQTLIYISNLLNLLSGMGIYEYIYHQIHVHIHKIMGSQIFVYYTRRYSFSYVPCP